MGSGRVLRQGEKTKAAPWGGFCMPGFVRRGRLCGTKPPITTEASVSPWGGDPTAVKKHFMPAKYILRRIVVPGLSQIASPREGLTMAGPLRGC